MSPQPHASFPTCGPIALPQLEQMTEESNRSLAALKAQLEECKEKSRKEITDSQKQAKDCGAEMEKMQFSVGRLQDEVQQGLVATA